MLRLLLLHLVIVFVVAAVVVAVVAVAVAAGRLGSCLRKQLPPEPEQPAGSEPQRGSAIQHCLWPLGAGG